MLLKELIESNLVKDTDILTIAKKAKSFGTDIRKGTWINDSILAWLNEEIDSLTFDQVNGWSIALK